MFIFQVLISNTNTDKYLSENNYCKRWHKRANGVIISNRKMNEIHGIEKKRKLKIIYTLPFVLVFHCSI